LIGCLRHLRPASDDAGFFLLRVRQCAEHRPRRALFPRETIVPVWSGRTALRQSPWLFPDEGLRVQSRCDFVAARAPLPRRYVLECL